MEAVRVERELPGGYHWCRCCHVHVVKDVYNLCFACERKWHKVYDECCKAGWSEVAARARADEAYPGRS